jgi:hypothetical protein
MAHWFDLPSIIAVVNRSAMVASPVAVVVDSDFSGCGDRAAAS